MKNVTAVYRWFSVRLVDTKTRHVFFVADSFNYPTHKERVTACQWYARQHDLSITTIESSR
jgi:hypothetical protein